MFFTLFSDSLLGVAYGQSSQTARAIEALQQALRINPEYAEAWFNLGLAYRISGETREVFDVYSRLKIIDPVMADKFFNTVVLP